ncbi:13148_t:CDS:2 [Entrophospora sp. SA101]|nr:13148_t:CDS:2 [Entrophospora sp. SA101]
MDLQQQPINEKANTSPPVIDINEIGWIFVQEYYTFLHKQPNRLHCFYGKNSHFNHGVEGEIVKTLIGDKEIKEKIKSLNFEKCRVAVTSVDCQASKDNGIIIQVLGMMSNHDEPSRKFAQTFFLATQPNGGSAAQIITNTQTIAKTQTSPVPIVNDKPIPIQQSTSLQNHHVVANTPIQSTANSQSTQTKLPLVNVNKSPKLLPQDISQTISKVDDEQLTTTDTINEPEPALENEITTNGVDKAQKTNNEQVKNTIQEPVKKLTSITWANLAANNADKWNNEALLDPKGHVTTVTTPIVKNQRNSLQQQKRDNHDSHDRSQDGQRIGVRRVSGFSIYVKGVKPGMTYDLLKGKFSKFGNVKHLDVVPTRNCAFVEYSSSEAYQYALNAKSIEVNNVTLYIEERRPPRRNNYNNKGVQQHNRNY